MTDRTHRRDFVRALALGASASAGALIGTARADDTKKDDDKPKNDAPAPKTEAEARMELVLARFGKQLDDDARNAVRSEINGIVRRAEQLRKIPLDNGDGPFPVFVPYRAPVAND
jgi:hypothetical protein